MLHICDFREAPLASLYSHDLHGTVLTRRRQLEAYNDQRGLEIARLFVQGKITNQIRTLKYYLRSRKGTSSELILNTFITDIEKNLSELKGLKEGCIQDVREQLLSIEGRASDRYWQGFKEILSGRYPFPGREHRGTSCPVNMMLNYGYKILETSVLSSIVRAGMEPYAGFLHADRSGRHSLTLDLIEEFRQPVVDRAVLSMLTKGFTPRTDEEGMLDKETREQLRAKLDGRLEAKEDVQGKRQRIRYLIQQQARQLASFFRDGKPYKSFTGSW